MIVGIHVAFALFTAETSAQGEPPRNDPLESEWSWVKTEFPHASFYRPVLDRASPLDQVLEWAGRTGKAAVFDRTCRAIRIRRQGDELVGRINETVTRKSSSWEDTSFSTRVTISGPNIESHRRDEASSSIGSFTTVGEVLSKVTAEGAWYSGIVVDLEVG